MSRGTGLGALGGGDKSVHLGALCQNGRNRFSTSRLGDSRQGTLGQIQQVCVSWLFLFLYSYPNIYMAMGNILYFPIVSISKWR